MSTPARRPANAYVKAATPQKIVASSSLPIEDGTANNMGVNGGGGGDASCRGRGGETHVVTRAGLSLTPRGGSTAYESRCNNQGKGKDRNETFATPARFTTASSSSSSPSASFPQQHQQRQEQELHRQVYGGGGVGTRLTRNALISSVGSTTCSGGDSDCRSEAARKSEFVVSTPTSNHYTTTPRSVAAAAAATTPVGSSGVSRSHSKSHRSASSASQIQQQQQKWERDRELERVYNEQQLLREQQRIAAQTSARLLEQERKVQLIQRQLEEARKTQFKTYQKFNLREWRRTAHNSEERQKAEAIRERRASIQQQHQQQQLAAYEAEESICASRVGSSSVTCNKHPSTRGLMVEEAKRIYATPQKRNSIIVMQGT